MLFVTKSDVFIHIVVTVLCYAIDSPLAAKIYFIFAAIQLLILYLFVLDYIPILKIGMVPEKFINFAGSVISIIISFIIYHYSVSRVKSLKEIQTTLTDSLKTTPKIANEYYNVEGCGMCNVSQIKQVLAKTNSDLVWWETSVSTLGLNSVSFSWVFFGLSMLVPLLWTLWMNYRINSRG